ncbi:MAG: hypothetical protein K6T56_06450 [Burkholderiales bacterium]|nr:hypothetical protein [Burkholderiales bacterium]
MKKQIRFFIRNRAMKFVSALIFGVASIIGCEAEKGGQTLNEDRLREIKIGSVVKLADLINGNAEIVCVLHPYQDKVADKYVKSMDINKYLSDVKYQASESYWSLVTSSTNLTTHYTFKRSKMLDIFSAHGLKSSTAVNLPPNFEAAECASFDGAALFKTSINDRVYVIFGSIK